MNTKMTFAAIAAALFVTLVVGFTVPSSTLQRVMSQLTGAVSSGSSDFQLVVSLQYNGTITWEYKEDLSRSDASRAEASPDFARNEFIDRAKKALAQREGYDSKVFGSDSYRVLSGLRVNAVKIRDIRSGRTTDIFRGARSRDSENAVID